MLFISCGNNYILCSTNNFFLPYFQEIPKNVFVVAACNPHRGSSLAVRSDTEKIQNRKVIKDTYYVRQLHPTLEYLKWDYGALDEDQEMEYIIAKMKILPPKDSVNLSEVDLTMLAYLIEGSQQRIRSYAKEQLELLWDHAEAEKRSKSCVSQRDIQRVFSLYLWLLEMYQTIKPHPTHQFVHKRALLVSLGIVYYMRLDKKYREKYMEWLDNDCVSFVTTEELNFSQALQEEIDWYTSNVVLPDGIAKTRALKENLFATMICCQTKIPLIIEGAPGSSKTLSFNIAVANMKGKESKKEVFRETKTFFSLDPHFYQCSRRTTSSEVRTIFKRAMNRQRSKGEAAPTICVVFMDEAGLPETELESLKALHYYLDNPEVSFVAITNDPLDAAKTNRAVSLFRPEASSDELVTLAQDCLFAGNDVEDTDRDTVKIFCKGYLTLMNNPKLSYFFGLRDFIYFLIYLRRNATVTEVRPVTEALERNFSGQDFIPFGDICKHFETNRQVRIRILL